MPTSGDRTLPVGSLTAGTMPCGRPAEVMQVPVWSAVNRRRTWMLDAIRTRLWPVPTMAIAVAMVAGLLLPELDQLLDGAMPAELSRWIFGGSPAAARDLLAAIAGSVMTVTSLTFSLTVVTLQLASSQFSPRLLRTFARDRFVQRTLGLFVATFAYALTVLPGPAGTQVVFTARRGTKTVANPRALPLPHLPP